MIITGACLRFFNGLVVDNEFMPPIQPFRFRPTQNANEVKLKTSCV